MIRRVESAFGRPVFYLLFNPFRVAGRVGGLLPRISPAVTVVEALQASFGIRSYRIIRYIALQDLR